MKKQLLFLALSFILKFSVGQNLVLNGDFEQMNFCPQNGSNISAAKFWIKPALGTPDYYNGCATVASGANVPNNVLGFQQAHSGVGYAGLDILWEGFNSYREYIEVPLNSTLTANVCYHFEMYINLANFNTYTTNSIGIYFSDTLVIDTSYSNPYSGTNLPFTPQIINTSGTPDTLNWKLVSGDYTAVGGEGYITIGNFNNDLQTDTIGYNYSVNSEMLYFYIDDVSLIANPVGLCQPEGITTNTKAIEVNIFPNPATSQLTVSNDDKEPSQIIICDITSRKIMEDKFIGTTTLNIETLAKGVYIYEVRNGKEAVKGKVVKE